MLNLFYDAETTGLPIWSEPSEGENQPHIVQLAAKLHDTETNITVNAFDLIVKPVGWIIPDDVAEVHGITTEHADNVGIPEYVAINFLLELWKISDNRIAHNEQFDARIIRIAIKRYFGDDLADEWKSGKSECTMRAATGICQLPGKRPGQYKFPKLTEAYEHFMGRPLLNAHNAMADVNACMDVWLALKNIMEQNNDTK